MLDAFMVFKFYQQGLRFLALTVTNLLDNSKVKSKFQDKSLCDINVASGFFSLRCESVIRLEPFLEIGPRFVL